MTLLETVAVAFSMFSAIPMPQFLWNEKNMRYALCAFPLIGGVIGGVCWGAWSICGLLGLPTLLRGAILTLIPVLITGGIHLDGYSDTWDALASHASQKKKQEILKDPHVGSFAVIRLCGYFVMNLTLWTALKTFPWAAVLLSFCMSRTLSGLAVASFPLAKHTGLAHTFAQAADKKRVRTVLIILDVLLCAGMCLCGYEGILMAAAAHAVFADYYRISQKQFGGLSGDLAGWLLQTAELWMLLVLVILQYVEVLI